MTRYAKRLSGCPTVKRKKDELGLPDVCCLLFFDEVPGV